MNPKRERVYQPRIVKVNKAERCLSPPLPSTHLFLLAFVVGEIVPRRAATMGVQLSVGVVTSPAAKLSGQG